MENKDAKAICKSIDALTTQIYMMRKAIERANNEDGKESNTKETLQEN